VSCIIPNGTAKVQPNRAGGCASSFCSVLCEPIPSPSGLGMAHIFVSACGARGYAFKGHRFPPLDRLTGGGKHPVPPGGEGWDGGKSTGPNPSRTLPLGGLTGVGQDPFPPLAGEGGDGGEEVPSSPPPEPSPIKGEGSGSKVPRMTDLPLSVSGGGKEVDLPRSATGEGAKRWTGAPVWAANRRLDFDSGESKIAPDKTELHAVSQSRSGPGRLPPRWCWQG
jgi:hypothetical protein